MWRRKFLTTGAMAPFVLRAQQAADPNAIFSCPMDPDVRQHDPGTCPRCGMKLASGLPEPVEYHMDLTVTPRVIRPGSPVSFAFAVFDPWKDRPVTKFQLVHERLFHMFVVGQDLEFFLHDHPVFAPDGQFHYNNMVLPRAGMYRVLGDFYPDAATPQLIAKTVLVPGTPPKPVSLTPDYLAKNAANLGVELKTVPERPIADAPTQLHFKLTPGDGLETYLGAWGHMLVASDDLIDMIHLHPFIADGGPEIQFNVVFPRPEKLYRVWVQFQRKGVVNTAHFDIQANELR
ncbi:MAG: heavy metal-binding domain-containing protein [Acidobacteriota bacterium]